MSRFTHPLSLIALVRRNITANIFGTKGSIDKRNNDFKHHRFSTFPKLGKL